MNRQEIKELHNIADYWQTHDSAESFEDSEPADFEVERRHNLLHPRLVILTHRPNRCPRCRSGLEEIAIEYVTRSDGRILVVRNVPALRCRTNGHEFMLVDTLNQLENLIELGGLHQVEPEETLAVPVFSLRKSA